MPPQSLSREIDFWFDFGSNYSYLSVMRIEDAAARCDVKIRWRPFLLGPIFKSFGWETSPFLLQKQKGEYMWKDMVRQCRKYGLPWTRPTTFPRRAVLPTRVALLGAEQPWIADFSRKIMLLNFSEDRDVDSPETVGAVLAGLGLAAAEIIRDAQTDQHKLRLREQTAAAQAKGIFGAPTFFVRGEMFWGNDRLDDALVSATEPANI